MALDFQSLSLLILRLVLGIIFIAHGYPKLKNLKNTAGFVKSLKFPLSGLFAFLLTFTEFFGGIFILVGFLTFIFSFLLIIAMLVATTYHLRKKDKLIGGYELSLILLAALVVLSVYGAGIYSIDNYILNFIKNAFV